MVKKEDIEEQNRKKTVDEAKILAFHFKKNIKETNYVAGALVTLYEEVLRLESIVESDWIERVCESGTK